MTFRVFNRHNIQRIRVKVPYIVVSISDKIENLPILPPDELRLGILRLAFFDTELPDTADSFTPELAKQILRFIKRYIKHVELVICQCDAGISRSAGVAAVLSKIINDDDMEFFRPPYHPNRLVYRTILNEYEKRKHHGV